MGVRLRLYAIFVLLEVIRMADMGTKEAAKLWGVEQWKVQKWCRECRDKRITQDKPRSPWHIPKDYPNPFLKVKN